MFFYSFTICSTSREIFLSFFLCNETILVQFLVKEKKETKRDTNCSVVLPIKFTSAVSKFQLSIKLVVGSSICSQSEVKRVFLQNIHDDLFYLLLKKIF